MMGILAEELTWAKSEESRIVNGVLCGLDYSVLIPEAPFAAGKSRSITFYLPNTWFEVQSSKSR